MKEFYDLGACLGARASKNAKHLIAKCISLSLGIHRPTVLMLTIVALTVTQFVWAEDVLFNFFCFSLKIFLAEFRIDYVFVHN